MILAKKANPKRTREIIRALILENPKFKEASIKRISSEMSLRYWKETGEWPLPEERIQMLLPRLTHPSTIERTTFAILEEMGLRKKDDRQDKQAELYKSEFALPDELDEIDQTSS